MSRKFHIFACFVLLVFWGDVGRGMGGNTSREKGRVNSKQQWSIYKSRHGSRRNQ